jgi:hypothetical protein
MSSKKKLSPFKKLPYELVSDIFSYAKSPASCAVTKAFYNECVKKSLYEEEFVNDLSKKIAKAKKAKKPKNANTVIKETCAENIYHKHICKKYHLTNRDHFDYLKSTFNDKKCIDKPNTKYCLLKKRVDSFLEEWDSGDTPIYEEYEAIGILNGESEEFVNKVIKSVDEGYRLGEELTNFYYDKETYKFRRISPRSSTSSKSSTNSSPRSSIGSKSSPRSSPRSSIGSKSSPRSLIGSKSSPRSSIGSKSSPRSSIGSKSSNSSIETYFDDITTMHNIPKKDANFAVVTYIDNYRNNYAYFNKYFKTLDEANEYALMRAYNTGNGIVKFKLAIGKDLKPFIKKRNIKRYEHDDFFIPPYKDEIISYLGGVYFFAVVKPYPGIENKWKFDNDKNMSLIYYPDAYYPSKTVYPLYMDSRDDSDWGNQIVENINAKTREKERKTVPWRTVVDWQARGLKLSFFKL